MKRCTLMLMLTFLGAVSFVEAQVDLALQPVGEACGARQIAVDLHAVTTAAPQEICALDVILEWDPAVLELLGLDAQQNYPYAWLSSSFPNDASRDGLNTTWADGDALYTALARLGNPPQPAQATPAGLHVTTFLFRKRQFGVTTEIRVAPAAGAYTRTSVYDGRVPGLDIARALHEVAVSLSAVGDVNCDTALDADDIDPFVLALTHPERYPATYPACNIWNADVNCDGLLDNEDIDSFVALLIGG